MRIVRHPKWIQINIISLQSTFRGFEYIFPISKIIFWNVSRYADWAKPWRTGFFLSYILRFFLYYFSVVQTCNTFANKNRNLYGFVITWEEYAIKKHRSANDFFFIITCNVIGFATFCFQFFFLFKKVNQCFVTSNNIYNNCLWLNFWTWNMLSLYSNQFLCHLSIYAVSVWHKYFVLSKYDQMKCTRQHDVLTA